MTRARKKQNPLQKLALELGPLVIFFIVNWQAGIYWATGALMIATPIAIVVSYALTRHIAIMPVVTLVVVLIFGGLTLALEDELFIKLKPTIVNSLFAATLLGGLAMGKSLIKVVLDQAFTLDDDGWRKLTLRWGLFFIVLAAANEIVWRNFDTDTWVAFKVWGTMPMTILFGLSQLPLLMKHELKEETTNSSKTP